MSKHTFLQTKKPLRISRTYVVIGRVPHIHKLAGLSVCVHRAARHPDRPTFCATTRSLHRCIRKDFHKNRVVVPDSWVSTIIQYTCNYLLLHGENTTVRRIFRGRLSFPSKVDIIDGRTSGGGSNEIRTDGKIFSSNIKKRRPGNTIDFRHFFWKHARTNLARRLRDKHRTPSFRTVVSHKCTLS